MRHAFSQCYLGSVSTFSIVTVFISNFPNLRFMHLTIHDACVLRTSNVFLREIKQVNTETSPTTKTLQICILMQEYRVYIIK